MSWLPDDHNVAQYSTISALVHGFTCTILCLLALIHNRKGPRWIKGYITAFLVDYVIIFCAGSIRFSLIVLDPNERW